MISAAKGETNFPYKLSLTETQVSRLHKALGTIHQLIQNYPKLDCLRWYSYEKFLDQVLLSPDETIKKLGESFLKNKGGLIFSLDKGINRTNKFKKIIAGPELKKL